MQVAQRLYEQGWITYMRTDSTTLSDQALNAARSQATALYGAGLRAGVAPPLRAQGQERPGGPRGRSARPARPSARPSRPARALSGDELRLYELIWKRTVASQMADATGTSAQVRLVGTVPADRAGSGREAEFSATGRVIAFPGFLRAYVEGEDDPEAELADREVVLPPLDEGDAVSPLDLEPGSHTTQPPARYTEASLVKAMEELGVGRPSTYASVIATILDRGYVWKKGSALVPSFTAFAVVGLLERYFGDLVDYGFTAAMENDLDEIAQGREEALPVAHPLLLRRRRARPGLERPPGPHDGSNLAPGGAEGGGGRPPGEIDAREINSIPIGDGAEGGPIVVRVGRYGPYLQRGEDRASHPRGPGPRRAHRRAGRGAAGRPLQRPRLGTDPATGLAVNVRAGRFGPYVQLGEAAEGREAPHRLALRLHVAGHRHPGRGARPAPHPPDARHRPRLGEEVVAHNGRFGPYVKRGTDTRSLASEDQLLTVSLDEARALFAQPKTRRGRDDGRPAARARRRSRDRARRWCCARVGSGPT